jgi:hypothetical protein
LCVSQKKIIMFLVNKQVYGLWKIIKWEPLSKI